MLTDLLSYLSISLVVERALEKVNALMVEVHVAKALEVHQDIHLSSERHKKNFTPELMKTIITNSH